MKVYIAEAWSFGYDIGYREAMAVKMRAAGQATPNGKVDLIASRSDDE